MTQAYNTAWVTAGTRTNDTSVQYCMGNCQPVQNLDLYNTAKSEKCRENVPQNWYKTTADRKEHHKGTYTQTGLERTASIRTKQTSVTDSQYQDKEDKCNGQPVSGQSRQV